MRYGVFLGSLSLASSHSGGFPYSVEHMAGEGQPAQAARLVPYKHFTVTGAYLLLPRAGNGALGGEWEEFPLTLRKLPFTCSIFEVGR